MDARLQNAVSAISSASAARNEENKSLFQRWRMDANKVQLPARA